MAPRKSKTDPQILEMPSQKMAVVYGKGAPDKVFPEFLPPLFGSVYTLKFDLKKKGLPTFKVSSPRTRYPACTRSMNHSSLNWVPCRRLHQLAGHVQPLAVWRQVQHRHSMPLQSANSSLTIASFLYLHTTILHSTTLTILQFFSDNIDTLYHVFPHNLP